MNDKRKLINKVKEHLGIKKDELILLKTYQKYNADFDNQELAIAYVLRKIDNDKPTT